MTRWLLPLSLLILSLLLPLATLADDAKPSHGSSTAEIPASEAICPVCRVHEGETDPEPIVATVDFQGEEYGFCSQKCETTFQEDPLGYLPPVFPRPAPTFTAQGLDGGAFSSEQLQGKLTLLDFWATWCLPCVQDLPKLSSLQDRLGPSGFQVVGISIDEGKGAAKKIRRMVKKKKAEHAIYLDSADGSAWNAFDVRVVPSQFLIDEAGQVVAQWTGKIDLEEVEAVIAEHLSK